MKKMIVALLCLMGAVAMLATNAFAQAEDLGIIYRALEDLIARHRPTECAVEAPFIGKNAQSALKLGQARGVGLIGALELVADKSTKAAFDPKLAAGATVVGRAQEHGVILRAMGDFTASTVKGSKLSVYDGIGHAPFWEDAARFNRELAELVESSK